MDHRDESIPRRVARAVGTAAGSFRSAFAGTRIGEAAGDVEDKAEAVDTSMARAAYAPQEIVEDVKRGIRDALPQVVQALAAVGLAILLVATAWIVFAVWLVAALNAALGDPWGTLAAWIVLAAVAGAAVWWAKASLQIAGADTKEAGQHVADDVAHVTQPMRDEFGGAPPRGA